MDKKSQTIFISYSHKDREVADALGRELSKRGMDVWFDRRIAFGEKWAEVIEKKLKEARYYVLLLTPNSIASEWNNFEIGVALSRQNESQVIPVLLKDVNIPPQLSSIQYLDGRNVDTDKLGEEISRIIQSKESE